MTLALPSLDHVSDADLLLRLRAAVADERRATAHLIALLIELDARRLYLAAGFSSLFTYCTRALHLTEHAAYGRIEAARAARKFPLILERLHGGTLSLTAIGLLAPHLTADNHVRVLDAARFRSKREVEQLVATLVPKPAVVATVRKLPAPRSKAPATAPASSESHPLLLAPATPDEKQCPVVITSRPAELKPLAPERFKLQLTISRETHDTLRRVQDLLRHSVPDGDLATIVDKALRLLLEHAEGTKLAATKRPRESATCVSTTRHIPAVVRRTVWQRDGGRCAFEGAEGRCCETGFLEFHHVIPYAAGGETSVQNLQLRCRSHNRHEAQQYFGQLVLVREHREA